MRCCAALLRPGIVEHEWVDGRKLIREARSGLESQGQIPDIAISNPSHHIVEIGSIALESSKGKYIPGLGLTTPRECHELIAESAASHGATSMIGARKK